VKTKESLKSQYRASLKMLRGAVEGCPDSLWNNQEYGNPYWHIAFHVVFYTHFYLHRSEDDFIPWEKHRDELVSLGDDAGEEFYTKSEILEYLDHFEGKLGDLIDDLDLEGESGFHWLPFDKLQLQFYNIRHLHHHTGELCERLSQTAGIEVEWVGMVPS
jgi:hypothetical protein